MDKQKQLEEMTRDICGNFGVKIENLCGPLNFQCDCKCKWFGVAERFYNAGYRKLDDHAIMALRKAKDMEERIRKETAEKFAQELENRLDSIDTILHEDNEEEYLSANELGELIDEICEEITEGK